MDEVAKKLERLSLPARLMLAIKVLCRLILFGPYCLFAYNPGHRAIKYLQSYSADCSASVYARNQSLL
jgi:hypothetical protein